MIEYTIKERVQPLGNRKGQTVYYALPKMNQYMTLDEVIGEIVEATSLARGDVKNAIASLSDVLYKALSGGKSVDLGELGRFRVVANSRMMDSREDVTVAKALNTPKIVYSPKSRMAEAAKSVKLSIDHNTDPVAEGSGQ